MTEKEMKETIRKEVNAYWNELQLMTREYGTDSRKAKRSRHAWVVLFGLWCTLYPNENWRNYQ